jgi:hypothetical protein
MKEDLLVLWSCKGHKAISGRYNREASAFPKVSKIMRTDADLKRGAKESLKKPDGISFQLCG